MDLKKYIAAIELLCQSLESASKIERITLYTSIKQLVDEVLSFVDQHQKERVGLGNAGMYFTNFLSHVKQVVGLAENTHLEDQQFSWIKAAIDKLKSPSCFGL